jgi:monoamine oxidase
LADAARGLHTDGSRQVIVVGAGFAGLAAAHELKFLGYDVEVWEGSERFGGRVMSDSHFVSNKVVEMGAELIGDNHEAWIAYATHFELEFLPVPGGTARAPIMVFEELLTRDQIRRVDQGVRTMQRHLNLLANNRVKNPHRPWRSRNARPLDHETVHNFLESMGVRVICRRALQEELQADQGVPTNRQSLLALLAMIKGGGGQRFWEDSESWRCAQGNEELANRLVHGLAKDPAIKVRTGHKVLHIDWRFNSCVVHSNAAVCEARDVVLAIPPSVWPPDLFHPRIPALDRIQMGHNVKYLMPFRSPFWRRRGSRRDPNLTADGPVNGTWEATAGQGGGGAVLTAFSGGDDSRDCASWSSKQRQANYMRQLEIAYPGISRHLRWRAIFMEWPKRAWAKASYSFPAPGDVTRIGPTLYNGCGALHFAGEHTCFAFVGFMEGALRSGVRAAVQIARRDGVKFPSHFAREF